MPDERQPVPLSFPLIELKCIKYFLYEMHPESARPDIIEISAFNQTLRGL